ncbi:NADP-dependent oxidoreductase [Clostridium sp. FP2]|uniref:NADP-dependent oxidoreductase n=1 Tax=Clostridium TaxID=1485 RepID=UPI0013E9043C|nr:MULTISPECIES: NADP-dependent oxidoreductase [Clostridium]MBW9155281.1 NADP-dependent oxidoreductase [Clostridium tagluense]MBZ9621571.1 NADP-dependent oxidoreductase [Clostridium sp. FP2]WLC65924.1 NADP-dependent oxidoreductase [Clostridium tagluense]
MRAVIIETYGGKEQLKLMDVASPVPKENEVLIEMHATSINPVDWKIRAGHFKEVMPFTFPLILGWDAAGVVIKVGENVSSFKPGDRVFTRPDTTSNGTYAEYITVAENLVVKIPENISFDEAASVPLAGETAWQCLVDIGKIKSSDHVLVHAGAGGVGSLAIQIAKSFGAYVTTTGSSRNETLLKSLGADKVINYEKVDFQNELKDYDLVIDTLGGEIQEKSFKVLKKGGILVSIVQPPSAEKAKEYGVNGIFHMLKPSGEDLGKLASLMAEGKLKALIGKTFEFNEAGLQNAHALSESHHAKGKIIIKIK